MSSPAPKAQTGHAPNPPDAGTGQARNPPETQTGQAHNPQEAQTGPTSNPVNVQTDQAPNPPEAQTGQAHNPQETQTDPTSNPVNVQTDQAHNPPEALEADDFGDETYATDDESAATSSITSSIEAYRQENGRTYHAYKDGSYLFPNDEDESDRLDFQHAIFLRSLQGQLHLAPIPEDVQNVLDIGTGTGIWAIDFADEFSSARVIGTDLSPTQPNLVPPNLHFYIEDAESDWVYNHKFDYIHGRMMAGSFKDYPNFFKRCFANVKPGGYLEMQDLGFPFGSDDGTLSPSTSLMQWCDYISKACDTMKRPLNVARKYKQLMEDAGFVDVVEVVHKWPTNSWPKDPEYKEIGAWQLENNLQGLQGWSMAPLTRGLGWSSEDVEVFMIGVRNDLKNRKIHAYWPIHFIYGRKPDNRTADE